MKERSSALLIVYFCLAFGVARAWPLGGGGDEEINPSQSELQAELEDIKQRLLADLGLSRIPDMSKVNVSEQEMQRMLDIYHRTLREDQDEEEEARNDDDQQVVVQRFYSFKDAAPDSKAYLSNHNTTSQLLYFPLNFGKSEHRGISVQSAKLQIFKLPLDKRHHLKKHQPVTLLLYQLLEPWSSRNSDRILVEERTLSHEHGEWEVFDITHPVATWVEQFSANHGLLLQCHGCDSIQRLFSVGQTATADRSVVDVMVKETSGRSKRSKSKRRDRRDCKGPKTKHCCRHNLTVSFKEIGWDWVVQPLEFEAYFCRGKCNARYKNYASNHALIQSILNTRGMGVPRPCCAPQKFKSLQIVHYNDKDPPTLVMTKKKSMIVTECACS